MLTADKDMSKAEKIKITLEVCETIRDYGKPTDECCGPAHVDENPAHNMIHLIQSLCGCLDNLTRLEQAALFEDEPGIFEFLT